MQACTENLPISKQGSMLPRQAVDSAWREQWSGLQAQDKTDRATGNQEKVTAGRLWGGH